MKVALVFEGFSLASALERERAMLARGLVALGVDVHVYTNVNDRTADVPGTTLHDVARPVPPDGRIAHPWHYAQFGVKATRMVRAARRSYDIVDVAGTTAWEQDVLRVHAVEAAEQRRWPSRGGRDYRFARARGVVAPVVRPKIALARTIERHQFRPGRYELALAVTEEVACDLREVHAVPAHLIEVVPVPIAPDDTRDPSVREQLGLEPNEELVLFVGHDFVRKGLGDAVGAVAALDSTAHLAVVGGGDPLAYKRLAEELGVHDRVHFLGSTDKPEAAFRDADVFFLPTREDVWGTAVIEAMAAGVPVVTTAVAGAAASVRSANAGVVVDDSSVAGLSAAVAAVLASPQRAREMGARGREAAARFTLERVSAQVLAAYERVCANRN
jgi:UDP-glucose:(heptosyl)LPS alpha-1,3-glucosyltransferase